MTPEVIEGTKIIAEFDGWKHYPTPKQTGNGYWNFPEKGYAQWSLDAMKYHTSWDWLMPVVEKISNYRWPEYYGTRGKTDDDGPYDDCVCPRTFGMRDKDGKYMVRFNASVLVIADTLIEATWLAVICFVKDYNNQQKIIEWKKNGGDGIL